MYRNKSFGVILCLLALSQSLTIQEQMVVGEYPPAPLAVKNEEIKSRRLQENSSAGSLEQVVNEINSLRSGKGVAPLTNNATFNGLIEQWSVNIRPFLPLNTYLSFSGVSAMTTYDFMSVANQQLATVVETYCNQCFSSTYNTYGLYTLAPSNARTQLLLVLIGGNYSSSNTITQAQADMLANSTASISLTPTSNISNIPIISNNTSSVNNSNQTASPFLTSIPTDYQQTTAIVPTNFQQIIPTNFTYLQPTTPIVSNDSQQLLNPTVTPITSSNVPATLLSPILVSFSSLSVSPASPQSNSSSQGTTLPIVALPTNKSVNSQFPGVILTHSVPKNYLLKQIFTFRGSVTAPNPTGTTMNIILTRVTDSLKSYYSSYLAPGVTTFQIPVQFNLTGAFYLSVFSGPTGLRNNNIYNVFSSAGSNVGTSQSPKQPSLCAMALVGSDSIVSWTSGSQNPAPALTQIVFSQGAKLTNSYMLSNFQNNFQVPYPDFWNFTIGPTRIEVKQAFSSDESAYSRTSDFSSPCYSNFNASKHQFAEVHSTSSNITFGISGQVGRTMNISGTTNITIENAITLLTPTNAILSYYINQLQASNSSSFIPPGTYFSIPLTFQQEGVFILEINSNLGQAILNIPIYVGNILPLLPDSQDLLPINPSKDELNQPTPLNERVSIVFNMLNSVRQQFGVPSLTLDSQLNTLSQNYCLQEISTGLVSHTDIYGKSPSDRAKAAGISGLIGQNLATNQNFTQAQLRLERSNAHLSNMVNPIWSRVGVGICQDSSGFYYLVEDFASRDLIANPLTTQEISAYQQQIVNYILSLYTFLRSENTSLSQLLDSWAQASPQPSIYTYLGRGGFFQFYVTNVKVNFNAGQFMQILEGNSFFKPDKNIYTQVGVSVNYSSDFLDIYVAFV